MLLLTPQMEAFNNLFSFQSSNLWPTHCAEIRVTDKATDKNGTLQRELLNTLCSTSVLMTKAAGSARSIRQTKLKLYVRHKATVPEKAVLPSVANISINLQKFY